MTLTQAIQQTGLAVQEFDGYTLTVRDYATSPDYPELTQGFGLSVQQGEMPAHYSEVFPTLAALEMSAENFAPDAGWQVYEVEQTA